MGTSYYVHPQSCNLCKSATWDIVVLSDGDDEDVGQLCKQCLKKAIQMIEN